MMKILKNTTSGLVALAAMGLASCSNDLPEFNDNDAFVAFTSTSISVDENKGEIEIPVLLTSLGGKEGSVDFEFVADETAPAEEGVNFTVENASKTLTFTKDANTQSIKLKIIELAGKFTGDLRFTVKLSNAQGVNVGADNTYSVTIADLDHPLAAILGSYTCNVNSYYNGEGQWTVTIQKDDTDVSKVWISNLLGYSVFESVYGTVNDDKTEIRIPVSQKLYSTSSYPVIQLNAYYGEGGEEDVEDAVVGTIDTDADGNTTISFGNYWMAAAAYSDEAAKSLAGYYELLMPTTVLKLNK